MATYLARPCPRCNGYLGIVLREPGRNTPLQAINGHRLACGYHLALIAIGAANVTTLKYRRYGVLSSSVK